MYYYIILRYIIAGSQLTQVVLQLTEIGTVMRQVTAPLRKPLHCRKQHGEIASLVFAECVAVYTGGVSRWWVHSLRSSPLYYAEGRGTRKNCFSNRTKTKHKNRFGHWDPQHHFHNNVRIIVSCQVKLFVPTAQPPASPN